MMIKQTVYVFFLLCINLIQISTTSNVDASYHQYLEKFGYTPKLQGRLFSAYVASNFNEAIKKFQRLYKLPVSYVFCKSIKI